MEDPFDSEEIKKCKEALKNNDKAAAAATIRKYLENQDNIPLNIAVTGESGSGKSTFVNAVRGIKNSDEGAAPTGSVETTMEVTPYPHPNYPNVIFWDLPGIGTTKFPSKKYLKHVGFEKFDFFIIISSERFKENDVKLALEIQKMKKKFYFVRSKIDDTIRNEEESKNISPETTLKCVREDCIQRLQQQGFEAPQVYLVSSLKLLLYDFSLLHETLQTELPEHKKNVLLFAMPNINPDIINNKRKAFHAKIKYLALLSAAVAGVPVPGLSTALDLSMMVGVVIKYVLGFGLDKPSLKRLADSTGVSFEDLLADIKSPLAVEKVTVELLLKVISQLTISVALMAAEEVSRFIPFFGVPAAMGLSFTATYRILSTLLDSLADDAQRVSEKVLPLVMGV